MSQSIVGQVVECIACHRNEVCGVVKVSFLALAEAINGIPYGLVHGSLGLGSRPEECGAVLRADDGHAADLLGCLVVYPGHLWSQGRILVVTLLEHGGIVAGIVHHGLGIPLATAFHAGQVALQVVLGTHLVLAGIAQVVVLDGALHVLTYVQMSASGILAPPPDEGFVIGRGMTYLPVYLRYVVIHPTLAHPFQHIGIEVVIVLQTFGFGTHRVVPLVAVYAERTYTELAPGLHALDGFVELLDELVHIVASPVVARHAVAVLLIRGIVGDGQAVGRIRIEIIVDVQAVHVVTLHNVHGHTADVVAVLRLAGVEEHQAVVMEEALGMLEIGMLCRQGHSALGLGTVGVYPCVALHATAVTLLHHPCQRVPIRLGGTSLLCRQVAAPGFHLALVQGIGLGTHLEHDGIDAATLQFVQLHGQRLLHPLASDTRPLVIDTLYPGTAEFSLGVLTKHLHLFLLFLGLGSLCPADGCHEQGRQYNNVLHQGTKITKFVR